MGKPTDQHIQDFYKELEEAGEQAVRDKRAANLFASKKLGQIDEWLKRKDQDRRDLSQSEQIEIARSAKDAAWEAARAAKTANTRATIALAIAIVSAIAVIIDILVK